MFACCTSARPLPLLSIGGNALNHEPNILKIDSFFSLDQKFNMRSYNKGKVEDWGHCTWRHAWLAADRDEDLAKVFTEPKWPLLLPLIHQRETHRERRDVRRLNLHISSLPPLLPQGYSIRHSVIDLQPHSTSSVSVTGPQPATCRPVALYSYPSACIAWADGNRDGTL